MNKSILYFSMVFTLFLCSCIQLNKTPADGDINIILPSNQSRSIFSSVTQKADILKTPENAIYRLYLIDEKGFTIDSTVGKPGGTAFFRGVNAGEYTLKCYYGLSASKINAVAAATKPVTVVAGETSHVDLELTYNRSNLIEKVNVEWAGDDVYYGDPDYLDDYILENTLIDFYLSNGWNESFIANDPSMNSFCNIENDVLRVSIDEKEDNSFLATVIFRYRKTPDGEVIERNKEINITVADDPSLCPDWATLKEKINSISTGENATFRLINESYTADSQLTIPEGANITIMVDCAEVTITPVNTSMSHLVSVSSGASLTIDGGENMISFDGKFSNDYTFSGALILAESNSNLTVKNSVFFTDVATNSNTEAACISIKENATCSISNDVSFYKITSTNLSATAGGAISNYGSLTIREASFSECQTTSNNIGGGGAIYSSGSKLDVSNATFNNCASLNKGGAIFIASGTNNKITSCIFSNNTAMEDDDVHVEEGASIERQD